MSTHTSQRADRPWRVLKAQRASAGFQFALTEALLSTGLPRTRRPVLRWYIAKTPTLVLGNGQKLASADIETCLDAHIPVFKRTSGGTAVLLDSDAVNLEVALPAGHALAGTDVVRGYEWVGEIWVDALRQLGIRGIRTIPVEEVRSLPPLGSDDPLRLTCYGTLSPFEVVIDQRKVVGLSQVRRRTGTVYQMSTYLTWNPEKLVALLALDADDRIALATRLRQVTAGLDELAGRKVCAAEVMGAVESTLAHRLGVTLKTGRWTPAERAAAIQIEQQRFQPSTQ